MGGRVPGSLGGRPPLRSGSAGTPRCTEIAGTTVDPTDTAGMEQLAAPMHEAPPMWAPPEPGAHLGADAWRQAMQSLVCFVCTADCAWPTGAAAAGMPEATPKSASSRKPFLRRRGITDIILRALC